MIISSVTGYPGITDTFLHYQHMKLHHCSYIALLNLQHILLVKLVVAQRTTMLQIGAWIFLLGRLVEALHRKVEVIYTDKPCHAC